MSGNELAALIVAVGGLLTAVFAGIRNLRGDKFKRDVEASAAILGGLQAFVTTLQSELERVKNEHAEDRRHWTEERSTLKQEHAEEIRELNERIDELGTQVYVLQNRPSDARQRSDDRGH